MQVLCEIMGDVPNVNFRVRLMEMASEYESLLEERNSLMVMHGLLHEGPQTAILSLSPAAVKDRRAGRCIDTEIQRPPPSAPFFDATVCDDRAGVTDARLFELLSHAESEAQHLSRHGEHPMVGESIGEADVDDTRVPTDEDAESCTDDLWRAGKSTKWKPRQGSQQQSPVWTSGCSTGNRKASFQNSSQVSLTTAIRQNGYDRRKRSLSRLGLLDLDGFLPTRQTNDEDVDLDEKLQSYWYTYSGLDKHGRGVSAEILNGYDRVRAGKVVQNDRLARFRTAVVDFNDFAASYMGEDYQNVDPKCLTFHVFVEMMFLESLEEQVGHDLAGLIFEIRNMFIFEQATKAVSSLVEASDADITIGTGENMTRMYTDSVVCLVIMLNAGVAGISTDFQPNWFGWVAFEIFFVLFFVGEIMLKTAIVGVREYYLGQDKYWNLFDFFIILAAVVDVLFLVVADVEIGNIAILRLLRALKVARLMRLLRLKLFKELTLLVEGVMAGMRTLFWAMALLTFVVFCLGMLLRQTLGSDVSQTCVDIEGTGPNCKVFSFVRDRLFSTVGRSMFTVLGCLTGGCDSPDGAPLILMLWEAYGWPIVLAYVICFLFVTFGLFNLIMAIFVENTLEAARFNEQKRQQQRSNEHIRVARLLHKLMMRFCMAQAKGTRKEDKVSSLCRPLNLQVPYDLFMRVIQQPETENILDDLGISLNNPREVFEMLDADSSGFADISELTNGFLKLRGFADKGDAVATNFKLNALLRAIRRFESRVTPLIETIALKGQLQDPVNPKE